MSENAEMGYVLTSSIEGTAMLIKGSAYAVRETLKIIQWMVGKLQEKELSPGEYRNLTAFIKKTGGNLTYLNIPAEEEKYRKQVQEDLDKLKIPYHVLPDLNAGDGMMQIVYPDKYKNIVQPWFEKYCTQRLEEGSFREQKILTALAGGEAKTGIATIPTEDDKILGQMQEDLKDLHISYFLMPDTNKGDGMREVLYAKKDEEKMQHWLDNFCQKHIRQGGEKTAKELQNMAGNKNQVGFINIPANSPEIQNQMKVEFSRMGINYHLMEDIQTGDGLLQVMYLKKDEVAVRNWYSNYATDQLIQGGRKEYKDLMNLTNGKVRLVNIPVAGDKIEEMMADFQNLHINYCLMPSLKINDNGIMILYADADADRLKGWYGMYQERIFRETGQELSGLQEMDMGEYLKGAQITADDYIASDKETEKAVQDKNAKKNKPLNQDPEYLRLDASPQYQKVQINENLVVENGEKTFMSRIPGEKDKYFLCDSRCVFETDPDQGKGKTYMVYIMKNSRQLVCDQDGKMLPSMGSEELLKKYDPVNREFLVKSLNKKETFKMPGNIKK